MLRPRTALSLATAALRRRSLPALMSTQSIKRPAPPPPSVSALAPTSSTPLAVEQPTLEMLTALQLEQVPANSHVEKRPEQIRTLCALGTGESVHLLSFRARESAVSCFERRVQRIAFDLHELESGITDVRICHPRCGEATFVVTLISAREAQRFEREVAPRLKAALADVCESGDAVFTSSGMRMPRAHSLPTLLEYLRQNVRGIGHKAHDVQAVRRELSRWFPRREEYEQYVHWDENDPRKYTRNVIWSTEDLEVLMMCWPAHSASSIHCHDDSSCWVTAVEGEVHEVQYNLPTVDRRFARSEMQNPSGAVGRCGALRVSNTARLGAPASAKQTYANNEVGIHRIENRTAEPAISLHVYAPRLRKMRIFQEGDNGESSGLVTVAAVSYTSEGGKRTAEWGPDVDPDGVLDVSAWNAMEPTS